MANFPHPTEHRFAQYVGFGIVIATIAIQVIVFAVWLGIEHATLTDLGHRFDRQAADIASEFASRRSQFEQAQQAQSADISRLEAVITRLDTQGGRQVGILTERQQSNVKRLDELERQMRDVLITLEGMKRSKP